MSGSNGNNGVRVERRELAAPKNLMEVIIVLAEAIMLFCYTERRHMFNLPRVIAHAVLDKGKKTIGSECRERSDCVELKGSQILKELYELKRMLECAKLFSSFKRSPSSLFSGLEKKDILSRKRSARILKPAFTVIRDRQSKSFIVFIRGTRSIKDTLTDALCAPVPFDHVICIGHERHNIVSGHAHRGMVSAADWIRNRCIPVLHDANKLYPHFKIKIVGHSLGGGTAALLTYKLREIQQFSSTTCVTFGPAACMTLELAEFGKSFITSIVNGFDIVPTLSVSSFHDFISEGQTKNKNIVICFILCTSAVGTHLSLAKAIAGHAVKSCTEVASSSLLYIIYLILKSQCSSIDNLVGASKLPQTSFEHLLSEEHLLKESIDDDDEYHSSSEGSDNDDSDDDNEDEDQLLNQVKKLKLGKNVNIPNIHADGKNIMEERVFPVTTSRRHHLYPPGKIMHIVPSENSNLDYHDVNENHVLYKTPTQLYGKLRFSRRMILDHSTKEYLMKLQQLINQLGEK
ncbi:uncharacterized protein [Phaseolus vulgaris]